MTSLTGTSSDDLINGTAGPDTFDMTQGGNDTVNGLGGNDSFTFGNSFAALDHIDGGGGFDTVALSGPYSAPVIFGASTMVNVEFISCQGSGPVVRTSH